ncbi:MAG: caspase family protein [Isosphaeraceae bacterium]
MNRRLSPRWIANVAVMIASGLGLGIGAARNWRADSSLPAREMAAPEVSRPAEGPIVTAQAAKADHDPARKGAGRRALLVGVTKYDHLSRSCHLSGPANDVRLMRGLLEKQFRFLPTDIVTLTEEEGTPNRRPTRANIEREFHQLAGRVRAGDQVVILLAGHGGRQPEQVPPDPEFPEPDGIDEIFLPADVSSWRGFPERVPNAIIDNEIGDWLRAITDKKAYVWVIFDCCHSGTMTRGSEVVCELPPGTLVPGEELEKAWQSATQRQGTTCGGSPAKAAPFVPRNPSEYLVAVYACRSHESTPEGPQPPGSPKAIVHGLLTYTLADILTKSAESSAALSYRELVQRVQAQYAGRPQGSPTPLGEGSGQDRIVLGTEQRPRSPLLLTRDQDGYHVNAGDLYGLTAGSILAVDLNGGASRRSVLLGHVRVQTTSPFDATVEPCAYEGSALVSDLPPFSACRPIFIDYGSKRLKVAIQVPDGQEAYRHQVRKAIQPLTEREVGLADLVEGSRQADWLVRLDRVRLNLIEASGNRAPFPLPAPDDPTLGEALRRNLDKIYRARTLVAIASRFEAERYRGGSEMEIDVEVLRHKDRSDPGQVLPAPAGGWVLRPGDLLSFRVHNKSRSMPMDVTFLIVGSDFKIHAFYPRTDEVGKTLSPGEILTTPPPPGEISDEPPFGPETLVVIAVPASNPPTDLTPLAQDGLRLSRESDRNASSRSPLRDLLESAMFRTGTRRGLVRVVAERHTMRILTWRTESK